MQFQNSKQYLTTFIASLVKVSFSQSLVFFSYININVKVMLYIFFLILPLSLNKRAFCKKKYCPKINDSF